MIRSWQSWWPQILLKDGFGGDFPPCREIAQIKGEIEEALRDKITINDLLEPAILKPFLIAITMFGKPLCIFLCQGLSNTEKIEKYIKLLFLGLGKPWNCLLIHSQSQLAVYSSSRSSSLFLPQLINSFSSSLSPPYDHHFAFV